MVVIFLFLPVILDVQETQRLELPCTAQRTDVQWTHRARGDEVSDLVLGSRVVTGDQHVEREAVAFTRREQPGERGVERLDDDRVRADDLPPRFLSQHIRTAATATMSAG